MLSLWCAQRYDHYVGIHLDYLSRYFKEFMRPMPLTFSSSSFFFFPYFRKYIYSLTKISNTTTGREQQVLRQEGAKYQFVRPR
jgi:hypothetical protein